MAKFDPVEYLVRRRYPSLARPSRATNRARSRRNRTTDEIKAEEFRSSLLDMSEKALASRLKKERAKENKELLENVAREEAARFFNLPN